MGNSPSALECLRAGFRSRSAEETMMLAESLAHELSAGTRIALSGDLGAGKTTFVKGFARGLGIVETVKSPSFNICCVYDSPCGIKLVHVDAYRLAGGSDFENLLIDEIAADPKIVCVEWPEMAGEAFEPTLEIRFENLSDASHFIKIKSFISALNLRI